MMLIRAMRVSMCLKYLVFFVVLVLFLCTACAKKTPGIKSASSVSKSEAQGDSSRQDETQEITNPQLAELLKIKTSDSLTEETDEEGRPSEYVKIVKLVTFMEGQSTLTSYEQERVTRYLLGSLREMFAYMARNRERVLRLPEDALYWQAAGRLGRYLTDNASQFSRQQQANMLKHLFWNENFTYNLEPEFDWLAFGFKQFDEWKSAGYPIDETNVAVTQEFIICPMKRVIDKKQYSGYRDVHGNACSEVWYQMMIQEDRYRKRFAAYLLENGDSKMVGLAALHLESQNLMSVLAWVRGLESKPEIWATAWRTISELHWMSRPTQAVLTESRRIWDTHESMRPTVLWGLAIMDCYNNRYVDWKGFNSLFDTEVTQEMFGEFLKQSPFSPSVAHLLWPTLTEGWSRADILIPFLDHWLTEKQDDYRTEKSWKYTIDAMCKEKNHDDLDKMKAFMEKRIQTHPDEPFRPWLKYIETRKCGRRPKKKKRPKVGNSLQIVQ